MSFANVHTNRQEHSESGTSGQDAFDIELENAIDTQPVSFVCSSCSENKKQNHEWKPIDIYSSTEEIKLTTHVHNRYRLEMLGIEMGDNDYYELRKKAIANDPSIQEKFEELENITEEDEIIDEEDEDFIKFNIPYCCICLTRMRCVRVASMQCGHAICQQCMFDMATHNKPLHVCCPLCRAEITHPDYFQKALERTEQGYF